MTSPSLSPLFCPSMFFFVLDVQDAPVFPGPGAPARVSPAPKHPVEDALLLSVRPWRQTRTVCVRMCVCVCTRLYGYVCACVSSRPFGVSFLRSPSAV